MTSQAKTFRTLSRFYTDSRSPAVHQPFERLELTVLKNSSSVPTVRAMRSTKLISRSNGSSSPFRKFISRLNGSTYPFEKIHQPFEWLELSVRENSSAVWMARAIRSRKFISRLNGSSYPFEKIHQPFERLELSIQERNSKLFWQPFQEDKTRRQLCSACQHHQTLEITLITAPTRPWSESN